MSEKSDPQPSFEPGKHSRSYTREPPKVRTRGLLLFFLPLPALFATALALKGGTFGAFLAGSLVSALFLAGAIGMRVGLAAEKDYESRKIAVPPRIPLKFISALFIAIATLVTAYFGADESPIMAVSYGLVALLGVYLTYGFDPRVEKVTFTGSGYTTAEVVEALEEAEQRIRGIESAARAIDNVELKGRLARIATQARGILDVIEDDPRDLRRARKFLNTYLEGARKVTEGYAKTHRHPGAGDLEQNFRNVLDTIDQVFDEQHEKLLKNDVFDLDVQIEVLATQLKREGVI
ncbi:MAG: 5-bromo-4-chloroindolyl phosphate hydrolysis family protein [Pseudomonadota bacterium]|nr:5-bromo-4-chloroindolyl phosphate hydrolysis family protein [Pseudomonadota bacterium]